MGPDVAHIALDPRTMPPIIIIVEADWAGNRICRVIIWPGLLHCFFRLLSCRTKCSSYRGCGAEATAPCGSRVVCVTSGHLLRGGAGLVFQSNRQIQGDYQSAWTVDQVVRAMWSALWKDLNPGRIAHWGQPPGPIPSFNLGKFKVPRSGDAASSGSEILTAK